MSGVGARRRWAGVLLVVVVLLTGGVATAAAYQAVRLGEEQYAAQLMDRYADDLTTAVTDRVGRYGDIVTDLAYSVGAQTDLSGGDFTRITAGTGPDRLPGATGVALVVPATTAGTPALQSWWRAHGFPRLTLDPAPGTDRHAYVVAETAFDTRDIRGLDLARSPEAVAALDVARGSGKLSISSAYQLLRDRELPAARRQTSVLLAAPIVTGPGPSGRFSGWVTLGLRGQDFMAGPLARHTGDTVQVQLTDPAAAGATIAAATAGTRLDDPGLVRDRVLTAGQRRWHLTVAPTTELAAATDRGMSRLTLITGLALTVMLAVLTAVLAWSRNRALDRVDRATRALRGDLDRRTAVEAQLREREEQLRQLAFHDPLTGLANRTQFYDDLETALAGDPAAGCAVLFVDLDGFKSINDRYGHSAGDTVLRTVADRLPRHLRPGDVVARLGGDEFAVILTTDAGDAPSIARRVLTDLRRPVDLAGESVTISASIGIAVPRPGRTADDLVNDADAAMYEAKAHGKNRYAHARR